MVSWNAFVAPNNERTANNDATYIAFILKNNESFNDVTLLLFTNVIKQKGLKYFEGERKESVYFKLYA